MTINSINQSSGSSYVTQNPECASSSGELVAGNKRRLITDEGSSVKKNKTDNDIRNTWHLFKPGFQIDGLDDDEIKEIQEYVFERSPKWERPKHISSAESDLPRTLQFFDGKVYCLLNRKKQGDEKQRGSSKIVSKMKCLSDGITYASASFFRTRNKF